MSGRLQLSESSTVVSPQEGAPGPAPDKIQAMTEKL